VRADQNQKAEYKVDLSCPHIQTPEGSIRPLANIHHRHTVISAFSLDPFSFSQETSRRSEISPRALKTPPITPAKSPHIIGSVLTSKLH